MGLPMAVPRLLLFVGLSRDVDRSCRGYVAVGLVKRDAAARTVPYRRSFGPAALRRGCGGGMGARQVPFVPKSDGFGLFWVLNFAVRPLGAGPLRVALCMQQPARPAPTFPLSPVLAYSADGGLWGKGGDF